VIQNLKRRAHELGYTLVENDDPLPMPGT
jgi:hypothetical protein